MAIDGYSPCPGGTGKKIKFCCSDLLSDLQKLDRMLEGEQYQASLSHLDALLEKTPDRACLLATRSLLLRVTDQWEAAQQAADTFVNRHPENPVAWAEVAIVVAHQEGGRAAMSALQRALAVSGEQFEQRVYFAMGEVAVALAAENEPMAALPLLLIQRTLNPDDSEPAELLMDLAASPEIPLLVKSERQLGEAPADAPWKAKYDEALEPTAWGGWSAAAERITALLEQVGDHPLFWRVLATLRAWLADTDGCAEALRKYAAMDVPIEDAAEAEALALLLGGDPLGDMTDVLSLTLPVKDVEQLQTVLAQSPQISPVNVDPMSLAEPDQPPPKAVYLVCDRAAPQPGSELTLETAPRTFCQALLFGRQTDREAQLRLQGLRQWRLEEVRQLLSTVAGDLLGEPAEPEVIGNVSRTQDLLAMNFRIPPDATLPQLRKLSEAHLEHALLDEWLELPLGLLDGKTPKEAAALAEYRIRLMGAILVVASWFESRWEGVDLNPLREKLGLPTLGPIDGSQLHLPTLPLVRLARVQTDNLSDEKLIELFHLVVSYNVRSALKTVSHVVFERPSLAETDARREACVMMVRAEGPSDQGIEYINMGRSMATSRKQSCALWDLMELSHRFSRGEAEHIVRIIKHIQTQHIREPGIAQALMRFLVQAGMVRPDGTPVQPPVGAVAPDAGSPVAADAEPGKLWTPDSQRPDQEQKIWLPGMD